MGNMKMLDKVRQINSLHLKLFAEFLQRLKATPEGDSNLLDQSMIVYGGGLSDGKATCTISCPPFWPGVAEALSAPGGILFTSAKLRCVICSRPWRSEWA